MSVPGLADQRRHPLDELRERLVVELRERLLEQALSLPLGNQLALSRVAELCRTDASALEIAEAAALDDGFAATLLRVANSAALGSATKIEDLPTAIARLGVQLVETLALVSPGLRLLSAPSDGLEDARRELHRHAVRVAVAARALATDAVDPDTALAAGLVHNLGLSILSLHARSGFGKLVEAAAEGEQFRVAEARLFGFTHAELGSLLAIEWSFPESLVSVIREHDVEEPSSVLAALVQTADVLVREAGFGVEPPADPPDSIALLAGVDLALAREKTRRLFGPALEDAQPEPDATRDAALIELFETLV